MAITVTRVPQSEDVLGTRHRTYSLDIKLDNSYPNSGSAPFGYTVSPNLVGVSQLSQIESVTINEKTAPSGFVFAWDMAHGTIRAFRTGDTTSSTLAAPLAELDNTHDLSTITLRVRFVTVP